MTLNREHTRAQISHLKLDFELLQEQRRSGKYCDLFLQSALEDSKEIIPCHKVVLANVSPFFQCELDTKQAGTIYIERVGYEALEAIIDYIYSGGEIDLTADSVLDIFDGAKELQLKQLEADCVQFIRSSLCANEAIRFFEFARLHSCVELGDLCLEFILKNLQEVKTCGFYNLSVENVKLIIQKQVLWGVPSTEDILKVVTEWLYQNREERKNHAFSLIKDIPLAKIDVLVLRHMLRDDPFMQSIPEVYGLYVDVLEESIVTSRKKKKGKRDAPVLTSNVKIEEGHEIAYPNHSQSKPAKRFRLYHPSSKNSKISSASSQIGHLGYMNAVDEVTSTLTDRKTGTKKAMFYFVSKDGAGFTQNSLSSYNLETKMLEKLGGYPFIRAGFSLVYHDSKIYSLGGVNIGFMKHKFVRIFNAQKNKWDENASEIAKETFDYTPLVLGDYLYTIGGLSRDFSAVSGVERFNLARNLYEKWDNVDSMSVPRSHSATGVADGRIYALGGYVGKDTVSTVECYDPVLNMWLTKNPMPAARIGHAVAIVGTYLYAIGGGRRSFCRDSENQLNTVDVYDTQQDVWSPGVRMNKSRLLFSAVAFNNYIYVIGGDSVEFPTMERFDTLDQVWEDLGPLPPHGIYSNVALCVQE